MRLISQNYCLTNYLHEKFNNIVYSYLIFWGIIRKTIKLGFYLRNISPLPDFVQELRLKNNNNLVVVFPVFFCYGCCCPSCDWGWLFLFNQWWWIFFKYLKFHWYWHWNGRCWWWKWWSSFTSHWNTRFSFIFFSFAFLLHLDRSGKNHYFNKKFNNEKYMYHRKILHVNASFFILKLFKKYTYIQ